MRMKHTLLIPLLLLTLVVSGCFNQPTPDVEATVAAALAATQTAQPTDTPTPYPTDTPTPEPTSTPTDTPTPYPTHTPTPEPTSTPTPTATPTPKPTATPTRAGTTDVLTSTLETGWTLHEVQAEGFAVALPPEWQRLGLNPDALEDAFGVVGERNPQFERMFSSQTVRKLAASGIKFYALDLTPESLSLGMPTSINIVKLDIGLEIPLDTYVPMNLTQIERIANPEIPITHRRVALSNVEAEEFKYGMELVGLTGTPVSVMLTQYLALEGSTVYNITLATPLELYDTYAPLFEEIGQTFRLLD
jgi:hypothetical protein